jgi:hypothetical protein
MVPHENSPSIAGVFEPRRKYRRRELLDCNRSSVAEMLILSPFAQCLKDIRLRTGACFSVGIVREGSVAKVIVEIIIWSPSNE